MTVCHCSDSDMLRRIINCRIIIIIIFLTLVKTKEGKKLRKAERGPKWKTSPGGPQRENRRAAIRR